VRSISIVAGARNHRNRLALPSPWTLSSRRPPADVVSKAARSPQDMGMRRESTWESRGNVENGPEFPGRVPDPIGSEAGPRNHLALRPRVYGPPRARCFASATYMLLSRQPGPRDLKSTPSPDHRGRWRLAAALPVTPLAWPSGLDASGRLYAQSQLVLAVTADQGAAPPAASALAGGLELDLGVGRRRRDDAAAGEESAHASTKQYADQDPAG
jgi:hypothetical protein